MKRLLTALLFVLMTYITAVAGPECKNYTMLYDGNIYTFEFACETAGIGAVQSVYNETEYTQWWLYFYDGVRNVYIPKMATFELIDNILYHIYYNGIQWVQSGMNFVLDEEEG